MATPNPSGGPLTGLDAMLAGLPISPVVRGGTQTGFNGVSPPTDRTPNRGQLQQASANLNTTETPAEAPAFPGMGELLEADDAAVFQALHNLNLRQERLAKNRLAQDKHWTRIKLGYLWSALEKVQDQDIYRAVLPPGSDPLRPAAVPNKAADLCNKLTETLMVDPPAPSPQAETDEEQAERAAEMAREFLTQDGGEQGTDDAAAFWYSVEAATTRASAFHHYWVDATGGGSQPLQIKAHPQATDPAHPLTATDPQTGAPIPTTDYILRYVTEASPDGSAPAQFTDDPSKAARQWLPKIKIDRLGREHVRMFPEDKDIQNASGVLVIYYCTVDEGRKRWPSVAQLSEQETQELCDWTPPRYLILLPPALRARWKLMTGGEKDTKGGSSEQRYFFYYAFHRFAGPDYPRGASIFSSGAFGGFTISRDTLSAEVPHPKGGSDLRTMDIPVVQVRLIQDPDDRDPTGRAFMERIGGANEAVATLATSYLEAIDIILHPAVYTPATSPVEGWQVDQARASGDHIPILGEQDKPHYEEPRTLPGDFVGVVGWVHEQMDSIASLNKPVQGGDKQQEVSGIARNIAVQQGMVSLSRMQQALLGAYERHWRIKLQLAMKAFTAPQLIRYVGEDGAYKQEWWSGVDFSRVTDVKVKAGTGSMMAPQQKVQYVSQLVQMKFMSTDEASDVARPTFAESIGLPDDPHQQRIERQVSSWLDGPPQGWEQQYAAWQQAMQQYQAEQQQVGQQYQMAAAQAQAMGQPPPPPPQQQPPPQAPWTPFAPLPMDDEPAIADVRRRRLSRLMATARFTAQPASWQGMVTQEYARMRQVVAQAAQPAPMLPKGVSIQAKGDASTIAAEEQAALKGMQPNQPQPPPHT